MKHSLPEIAIKRPVTVIMLVITVLGLGAIAWTRIPLEFLPKMDYPFIGCWIPYPGATPEQVENEIAIPAEGEFRTISHLKRISTTSDSDGCNVRMRFDWDADMGIATSEVRDRMERLRLTLPSDVDQLFLRRFSSESMPVLVMAVGGEGDEQELAHLIRTRLQSRLKRVEGVADVVVHTKPMNEVLIEFDQGALNGSNLGIYDVMSTLQTSSINLSAGELREDKTTYYVRAKDTFTTPEQIGHLVVGPNGLRLKDVARVGYRVREHGWEYNMDGKGGAFVVVRKEAEANTVATVRAVQEELERARKDPEFKDLFVFIFFDQAKMIQSSLDGLFDAGKYGGLLALVVLFIFLRRIRPTFIVAAAIPTSVVVCLVGMFFLGMTLNLITMCAMIIALGMLVDNAIVVIENIYRYSQMGFDIRESARRGAAEVGMAITAATLTTMVVFIPLLYLDQGNMATYMQQFALPVSMALLASLFVALTVIPLATSHMPELTHLEDHPLLARIKRVAGILTGGLLLRVFAWFGRFHPLKWLIGFYAACLAWTMRWRLGAVLIIFAIFALTVAVPFKNVGQQGMPEQDTRQIDVDITFDQNFNMDMADETFGLLQDELDRQREELGIKNIFVRYGTEGGSISAYLYQPDEYPGDGPPPYTTEEVLDIVWNRLTPRFPGVKLACKIADSEGSARSISVRMRGDDTGVLNDLAERFMAQLKKVENVTDVETDTERDTQEVQIMVDEPLAESYGISAWQIARTVDFALRGTQLSYLRREGRDIAVWAQFQEEDRKSKANLENVNIVSPTGELVPLNRLVKFQKAKSAQQIRREDAKNVMFVTAKVGGDDLAAVKLALEQIIATVELPTGYSVDLGDELQEIGQDLANFVTTLLMAIVLIYLVMGALFESYIIPLSILTSVPLAFTGVWWTMYLTKTSLDTVAFIGMILMVGVIVNNGIVILDHIGLLRREGAERTEAIIQAGRDRFRPVMMTALTTVLGCVPLAWGGGDGEAIPFYSLGRALIGGLSVGTLLTLLVVPLFYTLIDDLGLWLSHFFANLMGMRGPEGSEEAAEVSTASEPS